MMVLEGTTSTSATNGTVYPPYSRLMKFENTNKRGYIRMYIIIQD